MKKEIILIAMAIALLTITGCDPITDDIDNNGNVQNNDNVADNDTTDNRVDNSDDQSSAQWLIPKGDVFDGGPGKDGIPALLDPHLVSSETLNFLTDADLVVGIRIGDKARAYPHSILDWHEIANDNIDDAYFSIIYCPLTGTGMAWNRELKGGLTTFGVSGLLYNSNIIPYDRATDSNWSQMRLDCVGGKLITTKAVLFPVVETTWQTWMELYPDSDVVSTRTGYERPYGKYPYGDYKTNNDYILFPVSNSDSRVPNKERVHGVIGKNVTAIYRFGHFPDEIRVVSDVLGDRRIVVVGSEQKNFIVSFYSDESASVIYRGVQNQFPTVFEDNNGNSYDIFGEAINGPLKGQRLIPTDSYIGFWFAWAAFYPDLEIR